VNLVSRLACNESIVLHNKPTMTSMPPETIRMRRLRNCDSVLQFKNADEGTDIREDHLTEEENGEATAPEVSTGQAAMVELEVSNDAGAALRADAANSDVGEAEEETPPMQEFLPEVMQEELDKSSPPGSIPEDADPVSKQEAGAEPEAAPEAKKEASEAELKRTTGVEPEPQTEEAHRELEPEVNENTEEPKDGDAAKIITPTSIGVAAAVVAYEVKKHKDKKHRDKKREPASPTSSKFADSKRRMERSKSQYKPSVSAVRRHVERAKEEREKRYETNEYKTSSRKSSNGSVGEKPTLIKRITTASESNINGRLLMFDIAKAGGYIQDTHCSSTTSLPQGLNPPVLIRTQTDSDSNSETDSDNHRRHRHRRRHHSRHNIREDFHETSSKMDGEGKMVTHERLVRRITSTGAENYDETPGKKLWRRVVQVINA